MRVIPHTFRGAGRIKPLVLFRDYLALKAADRDETLSVLELIYVTGYTFPIQYMILKPMTFDLWSDF